MRINEVRKAMWTAGFQGFFGGGFIAGIVHYAVSSNSNLAKQIKLPKHSFIPTVLISSCVCSFLGSTVAGKNSIPYVADLFYKTSNPKSTYLKQMQQNHLEIHESMDDAFARREALIREAKQSRSKE
jgi:fructose-specific phosphotransferase system IIC component